VARRRHTRAARASARPRSTELTYASLFFFS
jgi:hypothetical protein